MSDQYTFSTKLFYSYCHKDDRQRESMEKALTQLQRQELLQTWSDKEILPGQSLSKKIEEKIVEADIIVFLISQNFIASNECIKEWQRTKELASNGKPVIRIPIILEGCAWKDLLADDDIKALPNDGKPITQFSHKNEAWQQVYEGIKATINQLRENCTPKREFLDEIEKTDFLSQHNIKLTEIFIFPHLSCCSPQQDSEIIHEEKKGNYILNSNR